MRWTACPSAVAAFALFWGALAAGIALLGLRDVNADARPVVAVLSVALPALAFLAGREARLGNARRAGALLIVSAATPTYFAFALAIPALLVGAALVVAPSWLRRGRPASTPM